jgi:hypothetical protein
MGSHGELVRVGWRALATPAPGWPATWHLGVVVAEVIRPNRQALRGITSIATLLLAVDGYAVSK